MIQARSRAGRATTIRVFVLAFAVYAYFMPRWADWNIDSRFDLVRAIVDGHTLRIDKYHWNTWDKAVYNGHFFSDKAPGTAILGVPVYAAFTVAKHTPVLGGAIQQLEANSSWGLAIQLGKQDTQSAPAAKGRQLGGCQRSGGAGNVQYIPWGNRLVPPMQDWALSKYVTTVGSVALGSALFLAFFYWFLGFLPLNLIARVGGTLLYGFATDALPYSTVFYSHQLAAAMLFTAFALIFLRTRDRIGRWSIPTAGFLLALALFTEYTVLIVVALIGSYALWVCRRKIREYGLLLFGGIPPVLGLLLYNRACFGGIFDTGYSHDYCWSAAQGTGVAGFTYPHLGPLWDLTMGPYRGLFYMSPFLLLALPGAYFCWRRGWRSEATLCVCVGAAFVLAISSYWGWNGGRVDGPRYLVPVIPFLAFLFTIFVDGAAYRMGSAALIVGTSLWSVAAVWIQFLGGYLFPISWLRDPIVDYSLPELKSDHIAPNAGSFFGLSGWSSLVPLLVLILLLGAWRRPRRPLLEVHAPALTRHSES